MAKYYVSLIVPMLICVEANNELHAEVKAQAIIEEGIDNHVPFAFFNGDLLTRCMVTQIRPFKDVPDALDSDVYNEGDDDDYDYS